MNDDVPANKTAKLGCFHRWCWSCLKRRFVLSVNESIHMPPRCCTAEHIPLAYVERLLNNEFKKSWNKEYQKYTIENQLYCPKKGCGERIKPSNIRIRDGRKYARCGRCSTKICVSCNGKFHTQQKCPEGNGVNSHVQMAKRPGWHRCYRCKAVVRLKEGCNTITW